MGLPFGLLEYLVSLASKVRSSMSTKQRRAYERLHNIKPPRYNYKLTPQWQIGHYLIRKAS